MSNKDFYTLLFGIFVVLFVTTCSSNATEKIMQEEAIANGVAQYNPQTGEFEWIKK